jgi:hydrogenase nickel incorporation protein HypA/HybF
MHELGLCTSIVEAVERRAGDRPVARVRVQVGRLHHVHPEAFEQSFAVAARGTVAEDAAADLVLLPVHAYCTACETDWECEEQPTACDLCGSPSIELRGGDELVLESIEYRPTG